MLENKAVRGSRGLSSDIALWLLISAQRAQAIMIRKHSLLSSLVADSLSIKIHLWAHSHYVFDLYVVFAAKSGLPMKCVTYTRHHSVID